MTFFTPSQNLRIFAKTSLRIVSAEIENFEKLTNLSTTRLARLDETLVSVSISRISRSKFLVSVSTRSRKIVLQKSWSRLGLEKRLIKNSRLKSRVFRVKFREIHQEILVLFSISRISRSKFLVSVSSRSRKIIL